MFSSEVACLIAIVDDESAIRSALAGLMRSAGLTAEAFASAEEFLASGKVDQTACLVLDVQLPNMTGLDLQRHLAEAGLRVPVIFITAYDHEHIRAAALAAGAAAFLTKPLSRGVLLACVCAAIQSRA